MKNALTRTILMTLVFAGLVAWYYVYEGKLRPQQTEAEEKQKQLVSIAKDDIQEITIERVKGAASPAPKTDDHGHDHGDGHDHGEHAEASPSTKVADSKGPKETETIKLKKTGTDWNVITPVEDAADAGTVGSLLSTLTTTKHERVVEESPKDLEPFGLKTPMVKVTVQKDSSSKPETVLIGKDTPTGHSAYAKVEGAEKVYRVPKNLRSTFEKDLKDIRNRNIFKVERNEIAEVEIQSPKETMLLKKDDKERWTLAREGLPADNNEWNKTLTAITDAKAIQFAAENDKSLAQFGLNKPVAKAWLKSNKTQTRLGLLVGEAKGKTYAKREDRPVVFEVDKDLLNKLKTPSSSYQSLRLADYNRFDINKIRIERKPEPLELVKENNNWTAPAKPNLKIDSTKVDNLLIAIQDAKLAKYLGPNEKGPKDPELSLKLFEKKEPEEKEKVSLKFGGRRGKEVIGERGDLARAFLLKVQDFEKLNVGERELQVVEEKKEEKKEESKKS